jgi:CRP/FNR family transcriptional regulator, cyclic AMP receptor protein
MSANQFESIKDPLLKLLAQRGVVRTFRKSTTLIHEGDEGGSVFIVLSGTLRAFSQSLSINLREITYGVYSVGDLIGEMSLDGGPRSASVVALETSVCAVVTRDTLRKFISEFPEFAFELLGRVIRRARSATLRAKSLVLTDAYGRLCELLVSTSEANASGFRQVARRMSHQEIAQIVGCSREMISRLLKDLERGEYIRINDKRQIQILKSLPSHW